MMKIFVVLFLRLIFLIDKHDK